MWTAAVHMHALKILLNCCKLQMYHFRRIKVNDIELILESVVLIPSKQNSSEVTDVVQSEVAGGRRPRSLNGRRQPELYWGQKIRHGRYKPS